MNWPTTTTLAFGALALTPLTATAGTGDTLKAVQARGTLNCPGDIGSYLGFAEVDDKGVWKGLDIELCRAMTTASSACNSRTPTTLAPPRSWPMPSWAWPA